MKKYMLLFLFLTLASIVSAQGKAITGYVFNEAGEPMTGVSVIVKGTNIGTTTGLDGKFSIKIPCDGAVTLVFSFAGYVTREIPGITCTVGAISVIMIPDTMS